MWSQPAQDRDQCMILVRTSCRFHKRREIIEKLCDYQLSKNNLPYYTWLITVRTDVSFTVLL